MATFNLGEIAGIHRGTTAPTNTKMLWYDDNAGQKIVKYYDVGSSSWKKFDGVGVFVPLAGGTMTGDLILNADPTVALGAATKQFVEAQVAAVASTLSGILAVGNTTGANDIVMSATQKLTYSDGSGGSLVSATTGAARTWTLPDATGTVVLGSGTDDILARWSGGALTDGVVLDDGTTIGLGAIVAGAFFNISTSTIAVGLKSRVTTATGIGVGGTSDGTTVGLHIGGDFLGGGSADVSNIGVRGIAESRSLAFEARGGQFIAKDSTTLSVGASGEYENSGTLITGVGLFGLANPDTFATGLNVGVAALTSEGVAGVVTDFAAVKAALVVRYQGTGIAANRYGAHIEILGSNSADNTALLLNAIAGGNNYALITAGGLVGIGVSAPTKIFEVSDGDGVIRLDTSAVTVAYNFDIVLKDAGVSFETSVVKALYVNIGGTITSTHIATGGLAVGVHAAVDSQLHVKHSGALADMDGGIRGTMDNSVVYTYATPTPANGLVLENDDTTTGNTCAVVFRSKDTGGTMRDGGFVGVEYTGHQATTVSSNLILGVALSGVMLEVMRLHADGSVSVGTNSNQAQFYVLSDNNTTRGFKYRNDSVGTSARGRIEVEAKDSGSIYTTIVMEASGLNAVGTGAWVGETKYFTKAGHLATDGGWGHLNIFARSLNASPLYGIRMFTGGQDYTEANLRMSVTSAGKFGFNLAKAGYSGADVDTPLSEFHVGTGAMFESDGSTGGGHFIVACGANATDEGGIVFTNEPTFASNSATVRGFKFTTNLTDDGGGASDDQFKIGQVRADATQTWLEEYMLMNNGNITIGAHTNGNEKLTLEGKMSMREQASAPSNTSNYGKLYPLTSNKGLYYKDSVGLEVQLGTGGWNVVTETTASRAAANREFVLVDAGTCVVTLPAASLNHRVAVKATKAVTAITIKTQSGEKIDGTVRDTTGLTVVAINDAFVFVSNGSDWFIQSQP